MNKRILIIEALFVVVVGLIVWRLVDLQILSHQKWLSRAKAVHQQRVKVQPERGRIYGREGKILALNQKAYSLAVDSMDMTKPEKMIDLLNRHLGLSEQKLRDLIYRKSYFTWILRKVDYSRAKIIQRQAKQLGIQGLIFVETSKRTYPRNKLAGHILGFTGMNGNGLAGVEYSWNHLLNGEPTVKQITYGADRTAYREQILNPGQPGYNLHLTLDTSIQYIAREAIEEGVKRFEAKQGWVTILDPYTGEVLAMAQDHTYNPNRYAEYPSARRRNLSVSYSFEPGSILKAFTGLAALNEGTVTPSTLVNGDSPVMVSGHAVHNALYKDWGTVGFKEVIKHSINTGMVRVAQRLGEADLYSFLNQLGFGEATQIRLPGEHTGKLRPLSSWSELAISAVPIGQSISVTAVQLASRMAAIANGGRLVKPHIVDKITTSEGKTIRDISYGLGSRIASPTAVKEIKKMLRGVVTEGTGQPASLPGISVAAKTGTAQKAAPTGGYMPDTYISSFAGFFPKNHPRYVVLVVLDEVGTEPPWGGATAGRVFKDIATGILKAETSSD